MDEEHAVAENAVVVGVDGSGTALRAVRWAASEAEQRGAPLRIVHVAPYALGSAVGARRADGILTQARSVAEQTAPAVRACTERPTEHLPQALADASETAQLLVVGMGGGARFDDVLLHSAALDLCAAATCPVVVVRGVHGSWAERRPVVLGLENPVTDDAAVSVAFADAQRRRSGLIVVHAVTAGQAGRPDRDREIADGLAPWRSNHPDVPVEVRIVSGSAAGHLLEASLSGRLLVVGSHARGPLARTVLGSTSRTAVRRSSCPVAVVRRDARLVDPAASDSSAVPVTSAAPERREPARWTVNPHDRGELW